MLKRADERWNVGIHCMDNRDWFRRTCALERARVRSALLQSGVGYHMCGLGFLAGFALRRADASHGSTAGRGKR
jgi:hypothetical protein